VFVSQRREEPAAHEGKHAEVGRTDVAVFLLVMMARPDEGKGKKKTVILRCEPVARFFVFFN
jgi:hypothetical protein